MREKVGWLSEGYTAADAHNIRKARVSGARHGDLAPKRGNTVTLAQAWAEYRDQWLKPQGKRTATDQGMMDNHICPLLGDRALASLAATDMERLRDSCLAKGLSPQTVRHAVALVRRVWNRASTRGIVTGSNPARPCIAPEPDNKRVRWLSRDEAERLLAALALRSATWRDIALMSLHTGMRRGEILALTWRHVDLANMQVHVRDAKAGSRTALMTDTAAAMLTERGPGEPGNLVFPGRGGGMSVSLSSSFQNAVNDCGLNLGATDRRDRVVFHTLRHTYASWLALDGVPLLMIAELLGHATTAMTQRYAHLCPDAKRQAVDRLNQRFQR